MEDSVKVKATIAFTNAIVEFEAPDDTDECTLTEMACDAGIKRFTDGYVEALIDELVIVEGKKNGG
jgi:hypothetical protein